MKLKEKTSLEQFNELVYSNYISLKKYIVFSDEQKIILEDYESLIWGDNPDLNVLYEKYCPLPVKNIEVSYRERDAMFLVTITLK